VEDHAGKLDHEGQQSLQKIRASTEHMSALLDALMEVARFSRTELRREPVNLTALVHRVAAGLQQEHPDRKMEFVIGEGITANGDPRLLQTALENLLNNACKFTGKCVPARIEFGSVTQPGGTVAYFVRDNGVGFDMAYADRLFVAFQRLHSPNEFPGTGIGLATVERIIRLHGGRVWAEGTENMGATFYFTL